MVQELTAQARYPRRRVLITGASGFVGSSLCRALSGHGITVRRAVRLPALAADPGEVIVGDIGPATAWDAALRDVETVIHLAARTHVMRDTAADPYAEYRRVNVLGTQTLALAAASAGVRRFVFLSSIKVNGEQTTSEPYTEQDVPHPEDLYGITKWEAEQVLLAAAATSRMETVVLRPPLVYGAGVKGNFLSLMRAIDHGMPLPFASIHNHRSLLYVGNLVDAITLCVEHPAAAGRTYLLADDEAVSTPDLVRNIASALGRSARLLPFPPPLLKLAGATLGRSAAVARLIGSLQIDGGRIRQELGWRPRHDMAGGLEQTARWYHHRLDSAAPP